MLDVWFGVLVSLVVCGCVRSAAVSCGDGTLCAPGTVCDIEHGQCLTPDQLVSCTGKPDGELCSVGTEVGICTDEVCLAIICGDGVTQGIEQCDGAPPETSCFDLGYDAGFLGCNDAVCAADLLACHRIGWKPVAAPATGGVFELSSAEGVGYAARGALMLRFRDGEWEPIPLPPTGAVILSIYAALADDAWALTEDGVARFDGTTWSRDITTLESVTNGVFAGAGANDVYLFVAPTIGPRIAFHFDGVGWLPIATPPIPVAFASTGPAGTFVSDGTGLRKWSGTAWEPIAHPLTSISGLLGHGTSLVIAGTDGASAQVASWDGTTWDRRDITRELGWGGGSIGIGQRGDVLYAFEHSRTRVVRFDGARWLRDATLPAGGIVLASIGSEMFAGTVEGIARESADAFVAIEDVLAITSVDAAASIAWGRGCDDMFLVVAGASTSSPSQIFHFDGTSWSIELDAPMTTITAITGSSDGTTYAATYDGNLLRRNGATWSATAEQFPTPLRSLSMANDGVIAATGDEGWVHVFFDGTWHRQQLAGPPPIHALALGRDEIYALTRESLLRFDGASWIPLVFPPVQQPRILWGTPGGDLVVVGANGQAAHREQGTWIPREMPFDQYVSVHGAGPDDLFAIGGNGTIAHFDGQHWAPLRDRLLRGSSVWSGGTCTYFVAGSLPSSIARLRRDATW